MIRFAIVASIVFKYPSRSLENGHLVVIGRLIPRLLGQNFWSNFDEMSFDCVGYAVCVSISN